MDSEIQKVVEAGKLSPQEGEILDQLKPGSFCTHRSWGFGKIAEVNLLLNQIIIDFDQKAGHKMQLEYAAQSLQPIADDHVMAKIATDLTTIKEMVKKDPAAIVTMILKGNDNSATQEVIAATLVPKVFTAEQFKKWWPNAKKQIKKDGHINVPTKRTEAITLREEALTRADELVQAFYATNNLKERIAALNELLKHLGDFDNPEEQLQPLVTELDALAKQNKRLHAAETVELIIARDELCKKFDVLKRQEDSIQLVNLLHQFGSRHGAILEQIPAIKQKGFLNALKVAYDDEWVEAALKLMHTGSIRVANETGKFLIDQGHKDDLRDALGRWITERSITTETLYWLCKERKKNFGELIEPSLLGAIVSGLEKDQFNEKKSNKFQDLMLDDRTLMADLIEDADIDSAREVMRRLMLTPVFEELSKRSLLARIIKLHPQLQSMLTGGGDEEEEKLVVSWISLDKAKKEYDDLVKKQIPKNSEEIKIAREYGDLRENFEFKAAKEMQAVLMRRKAEMEIDITRARGSDFSNPDTSIVSIGTTVTFKDNATNKEETYTLLGAWDSAPEKNILSYLTAIGQGLLGHPVGSVSEIPSDIGTRTVTVVAIKPFANAEDYRVQV